MITSWWIPRTSDIAWTKNLINSMSQDGVWSTTDGMNVFRFDHENKKLTVLECTDLRLYEKVNVIFKGLGWSVIGGPNAAKE